MTTRLIKIPVYALVLALVPLAANAAPTLGPNGHYYEFVAASQITWDAANSAANDLTFAGVDGHLATITSAAEDDFIETERQKTSLNEVWVGGFQDPIETQGAKDNWTWVNGEGSFPGDNSPPGYANWNLDNNEPNDNYGVASEQHLTVGLGDSRKWNDEGITLATGLGSITGYVVEYEIVARDDAAEATSGVPRTIDVTDNDTLPLGDGDVVVTIESPPGGASNAVPGPNSSVIYTADSAFEGTDTFTYRVTVDGFFAIAKVTVVVTADQAVIETGPNQLIFSQALNPAPNSNNPLTAAYKQVDIGGEVQITCCLVDDTREGAGKKALGYYLPVNFDIGLAIATQGRQDCLDGEMAEKIPVGSAIMRPWHRGVPENKGIERTVPAIAGPNDLGVCVIESTAEGDFVFQAEQAKNVLGYKLDYGVPTLQYRPITIGVALDPTEVDSPYLTSWTADTDESRSAKKYSKNVMVVNAWHAWLFNPSRLYLLQMADAILDSIEDARGDNVDEAFLNDLKLQMQKAAIYILLPRRVNDAIAALDDATSLALLIGPDAPVDNPYIGSSENWRGLWVGRTMALKFATCSELKHTFSSSSILDGACEIEADILAEMPELPGFLEH